MIISDMGHLKEKNINHFDFWQSNQFLDTRPLWKPEIKHLYFVNTEIWRKKASIILIFND